MAIRYWNKQNASANWNATSPTNWGSTAGIADNASVPVSSDDVIFDGAGAGGNDASTVSAIISVKSLTIAPAYTSTITLNAILTIAGNFYDSTAHSWAGASNLSFTTNSIIASGGKTFPNSISFSGSGTTKTLLGDWVIGGSLNLLNSTINATTTESLSCNGLNITASPSNGTAKIILTGGTWSAPSSYVLLNDLDIQGNVTISGSVYFQSKTLTYISGTVTTTGSSITVNASTTFNTAGMIWNNINLTSNMTLTLNSLLTVAGQINAADSITFAGGFGFITNTLSSSAIGQRTWTFENGIEYYVTNAFSGYTSRVGSILSFTSDHASNKAILHISKDATCNVLANFTRIEATGKPILTFNGTVTDCKNIYSFSDVAIPGKFERNTGRRKARLNKTNYVVYN